MNILLTYVRSWALPEKLPIVQPFRKFSAILRNPKVHHRVHKSPTLVPILSQFDPVHTIPSYLSKIHFNIVHPPTSINKMIKIIKIAYERYKDCLYFWILNKVNAAHFETPSAHDRFSSLCVAASVTVGTANFTPAPTPILCSPDFNSNFHALVIYERQ
jgi:hypothetical protein